MKSVSLGFILATTMLLGCSEHDCELENDEQKKAFGEIAAMTKGANHCFVSNQAAGFLGEPDLELAATHYQATVDEVATKYASFLKGKGWEVELKDYDGKRANGKPLTGKMVLARKDGRNLGTTVYALSEGIIETATMDIKITKPPAP